METSTPSQAEITNTHLSSYSIIKDTTLIPNPFPSLTLRSKCSSFIHIQYSVSLSLPPHPAHISIPLPRASSAPHPCGLPFTTSTFQLLTPEFGSNTDSPRVLFPAKITTPVQELTNREKGSRVVAPVVYFCRWIFLHRRAEVRRIYRMSM